MQRKYVQKRYVVKVIEAPVTKISWYSVYDRHCNVYLTYENYITHNSAEIHCDQLNEQSKAYDKIHFKYLTQENPQ